MKSECKPPYIIPTMQEIESLNWNGLKVASTFSGAGGSCTGYRMAGYKVVWANEFVPAAQASYKANAAKDCYLDCRDIKKVTSADILEKTGLTQGDLDLFDGSPPCQAFSTAGQRHKGWNKKKKYEHGAAQCNEQLFSDYIRLLNGLQPRVFVAENVSGLVRGTAKGYFLEILSELKKCGYRVKCKLLDAQWLGVPQTRLRTIFIGVRNDLKKEAVFPKPFLYRYSVREAIDVLDLKQDTKGQFKIAVKTDQPSVAITCSNSYHLTVSDKKHIENDEINANRHKDNECQRRKLTIAEVKRLCSFPDDFILKGSYSQQWERLGNSVPPLMMKAIAAEIANKILLKNDFT